MSDASGSSNSRGDTNGSKRRRPPRHLDLLSLLCVGVIAAGCGGGERPARTSGENRAPTNETTTDDRSDDDVNGGNHDVAVTATDERAIAGREGSIERVPVRADIIELARSGETVSLTLRLTNLSADEHTRVLSNFDDGIDQLVDGYPGGSAGPRFYSADGISLVDASNEKRHLVAVSPDGSCVCDQGMSDRFIYADESTSISATFGAPPEDVEEMDVVIPGFGTFKAVPLVEEAD